MDSTTQSSLFLLAQLILLGIATWVTTRRAPFQNSGDAAGAIEKFQNVTVSLQATVQKSEERIEYLESLLKNSHCNVTMAFEIGQRPEVLDYEWTTIKEGKAG